MLKKSFKEIEKKIANERQNKNITLNVNWIKNAKKKFQDR
jgi:hypothetical protein